MSNQQSTGDAPGNRRISCKVCRDTGFVADSWNSYISCSVCEAGELARSTQSRKGGLFADSSAGSQVAAAPIKVPEAAKYPASKKANWGVP